MLGTRLNKGHHTWANPRSLDTWQIHHWKQIKRENAEMGLAVCGLYSNLPLGSEVHYQCIMLLLAPQMILLVNKGSRVVDMARSRGLVNRFNRCVPSPEEQQHGVHYKHVCESASWARVTSRGSDMCSSTASSCCLKAIHQELQTVKEKSCLRAFQKAADPNQQLEMRTK